MAGCDGVPLAEDIAEFVEDMAYVETFVETSALTATTPQGTVRRTLAGIDAAAAARIAALGFVRIEGATFETGATVPDNRSLLLWATADGGTGFYYYFSGEIPSGGKIVPPDSTPASTGGTGDGGWLVIDDLEVRLAAGSAVIGGELSGDIAKAINKSDIRLFGVPSLDVGDLIQAALNATNAAHVPSGTWSHMGAVVGISDNQHIYFAGSTINKTGTVYDVFINASGRKNFSITGQCTYNGTRNSSLDVGDEKFIRIDGGRAYRISGLTAYKCRSHGFEFRDGPTGGGVRGERGQVSNIAAYECDFGIETAASAAAEYICFNNVNTCNNRCGIKDGAGNTIFNGGNCSDNDELGFWLVGNYLNNAHGIVSSMNINHNGTYNIQCDNVTNGHTFANNHIYGNALNSGTGAIFFNNSKGIVISGGDIDCWIYNFDGAGSGKNYIKGVYMPGGYGDVVTRDASNLRPKDLIILDCQGPGAYQAGVAISDPSEFYVAAQRNAASTQALTSGVLTDLVFNTVQANGDRRGAYDPTTGITTVPAELAGQCTVTATLVFQGTALNAAASFAELILPSTGKRLITLSDNGGVLLTGSVTTDVYLSAGQTVNVKAAITGTSPVFGSAGYVCTLTITRKS